MYNLRLGLGLLSSRTTWRHLLWFLHFSYSPLAVSTFSWYVDGFVRFYTLHSWLIQGLLFRGKGRYKRSLTAWKEDKPVLPSVSDISRPNIVSTGNSFFSVQHPGVSEMGEKSKMGFGRQLESYGFGAKAEKAAGLKGMYNLSYLDATSQMFYIRFFNH